MITSKDLLMQCNSCKYWNTPVSSRYADRKRGLCKIKLPPYIEVIENTSTDWNDTCDLFKYKEDAERFVRGFNALAGI